MSDNEESRSSLNDDLDKENQNNEENNDFAKSLEEISNSIPPNTIILENQTSTINNNIYNLNNEINENIFPYSDKDKIPEIKIKDENYFESGYKIENYLKTCNINFIDDIYNK